MNGYNFYYAVKGIGEIPVVIIKYFLMTALLVYCAEWITRPLTKESDAGDEE